MERSKHDLTGNDFDPLFDALSEDSTNLVEEMMRESYNSFKSYIEVHVSLSFSFESYVAQIIPQCSISSIT